MLSNIALKVEPSGVNRIFCASMMTCDVPSDIALKYIAAVDGEPPDEAAAASAIVEDAPFSEALVLTRKRPDA